MDKQEIKRGDIFYANLSPALGSEESGMRPVLVIQCDRGNWHSPTVIVAPITSRQNDRQPFHVAIQRYGTLNKPSLILLEQVRTLDKQRLEDYIGRIPKQKMLQVNQALMISMGLK